METVDGEKPLLRATSRRVTRVVLNLRPDIFSELESRINTSPIMHGAADMPLRITNLASESHAAVALYAQLC